MLSNSAFLTYPLHEVGTVVLQAQPSQAFMKVKRPFHPQQDGISWTQ